MSSAHLQLLSFVVGGQHRVSGLLKCPDHALACYVLAHGAGAGMGHPFMTAVANGLAERAIASLRYQFPYMEAGLKRPDRPELAQSTVRAAVIEAARLLPGIPLVAGGKSFGGRMTSQAQAKSPLPQVRGLAFLGFPLHPSGKPSTTRAEHLAQVRVRMLFLQGTRDSLADPELMKTVVRDLGPAATLKFFEDADHSFHVPARSAIRSPELLNQVLDSVTRWVDSLISRAEHQPKELANKTAA